MQKIKEFVDLIESDQPMESKFPDMEYSQYNKKVLFVNPLLDAEGFYKQILPAYELGNSEGYCCVVNQISRFKRLKNIAHYEAVIPEDLIRWARHIVMPFTHQDLAQQIEMIRLINSDARIYYHVDYDFQKLPSTHPEKKRLDDKELRNAIMANIANCDMVLVSNSKLADTIKKIKGGENKVGVVPLYMSRACYEGLAISEASSKKKRIGIIANNTHYEDLAHLNGFLRHMARKYKDKIELIVWGYDGIMVQYSNKQSNYVKETSDKNSMKGVKFEFEKPVGILDYMPKMAQMKFDLVLIPIADSAFNRSSKNYIKWLECATLEVPVMMDACDSLKEIIKPENAVICGSLNQWKESFEKMIKEKAYRKKVAAAANDTVENYFTFSQKTIKVYDKIFM